MRVDCHCDTALFLRDCDSLAELPTAHLDYRRLREHLDLAFFAIFIHEQDYERREADEFRLILERLRADLSRQSDLELLLCREQLLAPAHPLILIGMEGAAPMGAGGEFLREYYQQGLRYVGLAWNFANRYAGGAFASGGITAEGRRLVEECNRLGVLLDAAHLNDESFDDLLQISEAPFIDSHTVCAALCSDYPRAVSDRQMIALAERGGVVGITMVGDFLGNGGGLEQFCRHVEYAVSLLGSEHVAIGGDFDGCELPPDLDGVQHLPEIYQRLQRRGMRDQDLEQVQGESVRRLLMKVLP